MARDMSVFFRRGFDAPFGRLDLVASDAGLRYLMFADEAHPKPLAGLDIRPGATHRVLEDAVRQLDEYFAGRRRQFEIDLDLRGTQFQVSAWKALALVPFGRTASYAEQAASIGRPKATRAIGAANGRNPVAVVLPCHRIVGSDGSLTGFGGGLHVKQWLLDHERRAVNSAA